MIAGRESLMPDLSDVVVFVLFWASVVGLINYYSDPDKWDAKFKNPEPGGYKKPVFLTGLWCGIFLGIVELLSKACSSK
jgi:hypothetical protein